MADIIEERIPAKGASYLAVINEAKRQAQARINESRSDEKLITISDVFKAVCVVTPEAFSRLLGVDTALPEVKPIGDIDIDIDLRYSSEVDRYLSPYGGVISEVIACSISRDMELSALHIAGALLWKPIPEVMNLLSINGINVQNVCALVTKQLISEVCKTLSNRHKINLAKNFENIRKIREHLRAHCFGQDEAINAIITQLSIAWGMPAADRGSKPLSFFFVGAPGTGKNHVTELLQEAFELFLGIPKMPVIDFSRFATEQMPIDLIGRDSNWKDGGKEGVLTGVACRNPRGIIVIENYDRGYATAVSYLDTVLETGYSVDEYTKQNVCFKDNIFIIITHKREFAESDEFLNLISKDVKTPPRDKIIEGLLKFEPTFHSTLRVVDMPILFRKHDFKSFLAIVKEKLAELKGRFSEAYNATCDFESEEVYRALVETHPNVASAHPIVAGIDSAILMPLQEWLLNHYDKFEKNRKIRIECDPFPVLEGAAERETFPTFESWMEELTKRRISMAKRLIFTSQVELAEDAVVLRFANLSYKVMPTIEDSEYFSVTVPDVSFSDLVGVDLVKDRITEVIDYFNHPDQGFVKPDTGIVLYGPPGTGKTSVAKAIAKELGMPFINVTGADFMNPGKGVESVKKLFSVARRYGAVVFIDEIDAIGSRKYVAGESARVINAFLTELDGFQERNLLVIGATNRYNDLDEALLRPGRLSLKIQLGLIHNAEDRRKLILNALAKANVRVSDDLVDKLVETTCAWSPAKLVALVNRGVRYARKEGEEIEFKHFAMARTSLFFGEDNQKIEETADSNWVTAVHEAGHAVTAVLYGIPLVQATIIGAGDAAGFVDPSGNARCSTEDEISKLIEMNLAGRAAEELLAEASDGVQSDFTHATLLASEMIRIGLAGDNLMIVYQEDEKEFILRHKEEIEKILRERMKEVRELLKAHSEFLKAVAEALVTEKLLFEADILAIKAEIEGK